MMNKYSSVFETTNYEMFRILEGNRNISTSNYNQIIESMKEKQLLIPIIVNEKLEIIDGQHRYLACKALGLSVYFIMVDGYTIDDVIRANVHGGRKWYQLDYLQKYCSKHDEKYLFIHQLIKTYDITIDVFLKLLALIQEKTIISIKNDFKNGIISLDGKELLENFLMTLENFKQFDSYKNGIFITAYSKLYFHNNYNHEIMLKKLKNNIHNLTKTNSSHHYLSILCNKIYSYGPMKNPIYYSSEKKCFHT